jgi:hypothetical protein
LFKNDVARNEYEKCDYIIRIRLDVIVKKDILEILSLFTKRPELEIVIKWDFFAIGKPKIMKCYCSGLENNYGNYTNQVVVPDILPVMHDYKSLDPYRWMFAPERQLFEMLYDYCNRNYLDINKTICNIDFCNIIREK